ncbi:hypothetical protein ASG89_14180 [Paenibacillus sp. Soil766]|uniref:hypothetical protein n=1 Tax=Paenibacillus sp. Soil766 TaxID=1736404 RepID=UPI00070AA759|nr:hypothetical protein [Paenibacillus sp. Soil766]KRE82403.1 hypothetical protein ASG89_14180 [Paenibacillus sp. Soil766]
MNQNGLIKAFGVAGILGGLAYLPARFFIVPAYDGSMSGLVGWGLDTAAVTGSLFLFIGMLLAQIHKVRGYGLFSFFFIFLTSSVFAGHQYGLILLAPIIHQLDPSMFEGNGTPPLPFLIATIGNVGLKMIAFILFASLSLKIKLLPRWALIVMIVGAVSDFAPMGDYASRLLFGIAFVGLGRALWKWEGQPADIYKETREVQHVHAS